jgi:hypothetical protein
MSIAEIENAVDRMTEAEKLRLLSHLQGSLKSESPTPDLAARRSWMERLDKLRSSLDTGKHSLSTDEILDDLRGD